ncbi:MAG: hypothetical protein ABR614_10930 [Mycobacteriales bacterium]
MMIDAPETPPQHASPAPTGWRRRLCARLGNWCGFLLDTHHARIPF